MAGMQWYKEKASFHLLNNHLACFPPLVKPKYRRIGKFSHFIRKCELRFYFLSGETLLPQFQRGSSQRVRWFVYRLKAHRSFPAQMSFSYVVWFCLNWKPVNVIQRQCRRSTIARDYTKTKKLVFISPYLFSLLSFTIYNQNFSSLDIQKCMLICRIEYDSL